MAKDVNIHIKTPGADQAKQQLNQVADATGKVGAETTKSSGGFMSAVKSIAAYAAGIIGLTKLITLFTDALRINKEAIEEHTRIAAEQQKNMLALQAMGDFFEKHPQARKEVATYAEFGRRPFADVAQAWYQLESKGAGLTTGQKQGIMTQALELGRMEPQANLTSIIDVLSLYAKETRQQDVNRIQNVIRQTLSAAGADLSQMGQYLPRFLSAGVAGGLTGAETAGLWAFATTRAASPEQATVGMRNIFASLQGKGTPESAKLLASLGVTPQMNIFEQLQRLSGAQAAGRFGVPQAEIIAGKENFAILLSMLTQPQAMMETVRSITAVDRGDIDISRSRLDEIMGQDEVARLEEESRRAAIQIENIKGRDVRALRWDTALKQYERRMRQAGVSEVAIRYQLWKYRNVAAFGAEPGPSWLAEPFSAGEPGLFGFPAFPEGSGQPVIINDQSTNYYPRVGDPVAGPRAGRDTR